MRLLKCIAFALIAVAAAKSNPMPRVDDVSAPEGRER
jgi:hypothetical protein